VLAAEAVLLALGLTIDQAKRLMIREERRRRAASVRRAPSASLPPSSRLSGTSDNTIVPDRAHNRVF